MTATLQEQKESVSQERATSSPRRRRWLEVVSHTDPRYGGLSSAVPALAAALSREYPLDLSLAAFCHPHEQHQPGSLSAEQVSFWPTSRKTWLLDRDLSARFGALVREADALHIHGLWEQSTRTACKLARQAGKPYVLSAHGMLEPWALAAKRLKKQIYAALIERANVSGAACLHALTPAEAEQYRQFGARGPIAVVPNAVHVPEHLDPAPFLERFPALAGRRLVLFLSRLHPKKGLDLLLEAWAHLAPQHADAHLVIAGPDDGMEAPLKQQAAQRGVAAHITFTGMLAGSLKWSALAAAEVYVLPSYSEGLSMALLEAMGAGVPVIATRACNMPEISACNTGWEIEATAAALTSALGDALAGTPETHWAKGQNGARLIAEHYSPANVVRAMAEVYDFVLGGTPPQCIQLAKGGA